MDEYGHRYNGLAATIQLELEANFFVGSPSTQIAEDCFMKLETEQKNV